MNQENVMRMRQPKRGVQTRNDHEYAMKKAFTSDALALLLPAYPAHASARQAASPDKAEQSHKQIVEASFMAENQAAMDKMTAALGQPLSEATSSATRSGHASQDGARPARNAAR
jgi:hypothetical protein